MDMKTTQILMHRHQKLFFKDKGMFLSSLITPVILIVLYMTFLDRIYHNSFVSYMPKNFSLSSSIINTTVASQLISSLLAVTCVTVTFSVNMTMVQDYALGIRKDFDIAPVKKSVLYLSYLFATILNSLIVNMVALILGLFYIATRGWYLQAVDIVWLIGDVVLLVVFGAVLSGIICFPLRTQGARNAVGTIVSAGYGFFCGAYMPLHYFGTHLQNVMSFFPSTYATSLLKNHFLSRPFHQMQEAGVPKAVIKEIAISLDCKPKLLGHVVSVEMMILLLLMATIILLVLYLFLSQYRSKKLS